MTQKEIVKTIKRINERMAVYQRQGLTDSTNYKKMVERVKLLDIPFSDTKGRFKISLKKSDIAKMDVDNITILDNLPSLKQERQQARKQGYKTTKEQNQYIVNRGNLESWISENLDFVYNDSRSGMESALQLQGLFKDGLRKVDYEKVNTLIKKYEEEKAKEFAMLHDSEFYNDDIF